MRIVAVASGILQDGSKIDPKYAVTPRSLNDPHVLHRYADVFLMENCTFLSKFLSRSWHLYFLQAAAQFEQQTAAARSRYGATSPYFHVQIAIYLRPQVLQLAYQRGARARAHISQGARM